MLFKQETLQWGEDSPGPQRQEHAQPPQSAGHSSQEINALRSRPQPMAHENGELTTQLPHPRGGTTLMVFHADGLGCHNKMPQTQWLKQQKCVFSVLKAGRLGSGRQHVGFW